MGVDVFSVLVWLVLSLVASASIGYRAPSGRLSAFTEALSAALPLYLAAGTTAAIVVQFIRGKEIVGLAILWLAAVIGLAWSLRNSGWLLMVRLVFVVWLLVLGISPD